MPGRPRCAGRRATAGWDAGLLVLLALPWRVIVRSDPDCTQSRAAAENPGAAGVLVLAASGVDLAAAIARLPRPEAFAPMRAVAFLPGLGMALAAHLAAARPEVAFIEYLPAELCAAGLRKDLAREDLTMVDGRIPLPTRPGLGVDLDRSALERYRVD